MTIKEVSERFGVSTDTLRYYERIGLIPQIARTARRYTRLYRIRYQLGGAHYMYAQCRSSD